MTWVQNLSNDSLADFWRDYGTALLIAGSLLGAVALAGFVIYAKAKHKPLRRGALSASMNLALLINAEGMWEFVTKRAQFPTAFAVLVFAVFEICFLTATSLAADRYEKTTERDADGKITKPGHPGKMLWVAFVIAVFSGGVVATTADTTGVAVFRIGIPLMIFVMWWAALTAAGQVAKRGTFAHSPRRLFERWGWIIAEEDAQFDKLAHERKVRKIVVYGDRLRTNTPPAWLWEWRLRRLTRTADPAVAQDAVTQLDRSDEMLTLIAPNRMAARGEQKILLAATAEQDSEQKRADGEQNSEQSQVDGGQRRADELPAWADGADAQPLFGGDEAPPALPSAEAGQPRADEVDAQVETPDVRALPAGPDTPVAPGPRRPLEDGAGTSGRSAGRPWVLAEPTLPAEDLVAVKGSPAWREEVERLSVALAAELRPGDGNIGGRGIRQLTAILAPQVPRLAEDQVDGFVRDWMDALAGYAPEAGQPWIDLLPQVKAQVGTPAWDHAVERLSEALNATMRPQDLRGQSSGRNAIQLIEELAPKVPELQRETILAYVGDYALARIGQPISSGLPWEQHMPPKEQLEDEELIAYYGERFRRLAGEGKFTAYQVGVLTGAARRQQDRVYKMFLGLQDTVSMAGGNR